MIATSTIITHMTLSLSTTQPILSILPLIHAHPVFYYIQMTINPSPNPNPSYVIIIVTTFR